MWKSNS